MFQEDSESSSPVSHDEIVISTSKTKLCSANITPGLNSFIDLHSYFQIPSTTEQNIWSDDNNPASSEQSVRREEEDAALGSGQGDGGEGCAYDEEITDDIDDRKLG